MNNLFLDLYGDAIKDKIILNEMPTFESIRSYFSKFDEIERTFIFNNKVIRAQRKIVFQHQQLKSNYLHIFIQMDLFNNFIHYIETKEGNFKIK